MFDDRSFRLLLPAVALFLALVGLRFVHLEADTPADVDTAGVGLWVDEGYKTLSARNLYLHGRSHATPYDAYPGWLRSSPLTQLALCLGFDLLDGATLGNARRVAVAWFALFLALYLVTSLGRHPPRLVFAGLALLGLVHPLFFFSRVALFEMPLMAVLYALLFALRVDRLARPLPAALLLVSFTLAATLTIKPSAPVHFAPVALGVAVAWLLTTRRTRNEVLSFAAGFGVVFAVLAWLGRDRFLNRLDFSPEQVVSSFFVGYLHHTSALLIAAGLLAAAHVVLTDPRRFLAHPYRASLVAIVVVGPLLFGFFSRTPLRYLVPFAPSYLLLVLEWLAVGAWRWPLAWRGWRTVAAWPVVAALGIALFQAFNYHVLELVPARLGTMPGISDEAVFAYLVPLAVVAAAVGLAFLRRVRPPERLVLGAVLLLLVLSTARDVYVVGRFLLAPTWDLRETSAALDAAVPRGQSVGGDWAPLFALGTGADALFIGIDANFGIRHFRCLRPDFFLWSETDDGKEVLCMVESFRDVHLEREFESSYVGRGVVLYRLRYDRPPTPMDCAHDDPRSRVPPKTKWDRWLDKLWGWR